MKTRRQHPLACSPAHMFTCLRVPFLLLALVLLAAPTHAAPTALYDGSLGGLPATQGMLFFGPGLIQTFASGVTTLDSSANKALQGGYTPQPALITTLDRTKGATLHFRIQLATEDHTGSDRNDDQIDDRAGFSVILLSSDKQGIELGFWTNRIWAQAGGGVGDGPIFTQSEGIALDTGIERAYELAIHANTYTLQADGAQILSGPLRNYSAFGSVYTTPNYLFLGDDTTSAAARVRVVLVSLQNYTQRVTLPLIRA